MKKILEKNGYEVWAKWDREAEVYELFNDREDGAYIGSASSLKECVINGTWWIEEQQWESAWNAS